MTVSRKTWPARFGNRVAKATARLPEHRLALGLGVFGVAIFLAIVAFSATTGPPGQKPYRVTVIVPGDAPTVRSGLAVRIGGKLAGLISAAEPDRRAHATRVTANITKSEFRPLPSDTTANVRVSSILYRTSLELNPGTSRDTLDDGDALRAPATDNVDLLEVVQLFDRNTRVALRDTVTNVGIGVAGRGAAVNEELRHLPRLSRNVSAQLRAVTREPRALERLIAGGAQTARGLIGARADDVGALIGSSDAVLAAVAERRDDLRATIRLLAPFEDQVLAVAPVATPALDDVAATADDLAPTVRALNRVLPTLDRLFSKGESLRVETDLVQDAIDPVVAAGRPVIVGLFPVLTALGPLNRDLDLIKSTVGPYLADIAEGGRRLAEATSDPSDGGHDPGGPTLRGVLVLTPRPCYRIDPEPGKAVTDRC